MNKALVDLLTPTLSMDDNMLDTIVAPAANAGIYSLIGIANFDELVASRNELIGLTRKAKTASIVESFITDQWKVEPIDGVDAIDGVDEIIDPIAGNVIVEGVEAIEGIEPVEGVLSTFRSAINSVETVINDELLPEIHVDDAKDISFTVEFRYDSETEHRYTARPSLLNKGANGKSNGDKKASNGGGNGGNGKSWKANCWKAINPDTSTTKARLLASMCQNAGVDISDMPAKVEDEHVESLWHRCASGYNLTGDPSDITNKGLANHYETVRMSDNRPVFSE